VFVICIKLGFLVACKGHDPSHLTAAQLPSHKHNNTNMSKNVSQRGCLSDRFGVNLPSQGRLEKLHI
jgi:hypothetical protein